MGGAGLASAEVGLGSRHLNRSGILIRPGNGLPRSRIGIVSVLAARTINMGGPLGPARPRPGLILAVTDILAHLSLGSVSGHRAVAEERRRYVAQYTDRRRGRRADDGIHRAIGVFLFLLAGLRVALELGWLNQAAEVAVPDPSHPISILSQSPSIPLGSLPAAASHIARVALPGCQPCRVVAAPLICWRGAWGGQAL
jgi:hypothetical protein